MVDTKYKTMKQVMNVWRRSKYLGRAIMIINITAIIYYLIYTLHITEKGIEQSFAPLTASLFLSVFLINLLTLCNYYRMSEFYLKILSNSYQEEKTKFKLIVTIYIMFIILSNIKENCVFYIVELVILIQGKYIPEQDWNLIIKTLHCLNIVRG